MAHGDYYNPANKSVTDGTVVYADDINKINTAIDSALEQVAYDLDVIEADLEAGGLSAKNWATEDQGTRPDPILDLYSAKAYALEAKDWASASGTITEASTGAALAGSASAKTKAAEAAASALAASGSASSASGSASIATTKAGEALNSANAAALSETNAGNSAISAAASAANLPNATTAGANKLLTTNSSGNGWEYPSITTAGKAILDDASAAEQRATLGIGASTGKNLLINGGFDVWQRGTSFSPNGVGIPVYTADRWRCINGPAVTSATRQIFTQNSASGLFYASYVYRATFAGSYGGVKILSQFVEGLPRFLGKTITLSFYARSSIASGSIYVQRELYYGDEMVPGDGSPPTGYTPAPHGNLTTSWVRYSATFTIQDGTAKTITEPNHGFRLNIVTSVSGGYVEVAKVQLEYGYTATDFEYRHPAEELMLCQRYYESGTIRGPFAQYLANFVVGPQVSFLVEKRKTPLVTLGTLSTTGNDGTPGVLYSANENTRGINPVYNWTGGTVGRSFFGQVTWSADAEI